MDTFVVRLKGKPKEYVDYFLEKGYFNTKSEIVRLGILELSRKYLLNDEISKKELKLVGNAVERDLKKIKSTKQKFYTENDFKKKFAHLRK